MQIIVPFEPAENDIPANFMLPQLERGESISTMVVSEDDLALGTSQCRILQYKMAGYATVTSSGAAMGASAGYGKEFVVPSQTASPTRSPGAMKDTTRLSPRTKQPIEVPSYVPPRPALSLDPSLLQSDNPNVRNGMNDRIKSIFTAYTLAGEPTLTPLGGAAHNTSSFGPLTENPLLVPSRRLVSPQLTQHAVTSTDGDYLMTIPTASVEVDLLEDHSTKKPNKPRHNHKKVKKPAEPIPNPNKTIYAKKIAALCFQENQNRGHRSDDDRSRKGAGTVSLSTILLLTSQVRLFLTIISWLGPAFSRRKQSKGHPPSISTHSASKFQVRGYVRPRRVQQHGSISWLGLSTNNAKCVRFSRAAASLLQSSPPIGYFAKPIQRKPCDTKAGKHCA